MGVAYLEASLEKLAPLTLVHDIPGDSTVRKRFTVIVKDIVIGLRKAVIWLDLFPPGQRPWKHHSCTWHTQ